MSISVPSWKSCGVSVYYARAICRKVQVGSSFITGLLVSRAEKGDFSGSLQTSESKPCPCQYNVTSSTVFQIMNETDVRKQMWWLACNELHFNNTYCQSINQTSIAPISLGKASSVALQPNQCPTAKLRRQFRNINRPWGYTSTYGERPSQRDVSSHVS